jgi:hypothetical protein
VEDNRVGKVGVTTGRCVWRYWNGSGKGERKERAGVKVKAYKVTNNSL